jgi:hypothetical protein
LTKFKHFASNKLQWLEQVGIGYLDAPAVPYDLEYFQKYIEYEMTELGVNLTEARSALVDKHTTGTVIDVGVGSGAFCKARRDTFGCDINPHAIEWLAERGLYRTPDSERPVDALTFWDSLEHIPDPSELLAGAKEFVFVSCPIYDGVQDVLASKHFRPGEHFWYWTNEGMQNFMAHFGFQLVEHNEIESDLGRESIGTFVFKRAS